VNTLDVDETCAEEREALIFPRGEQGRELGLGGSVVVRVEQHATRSQRHARAFEECTDVFSAETVCTGICTPKPADETCHFDASGTYVGAS